MQKVAEEKKVGEHSIKIIYAEEGKSLEEWLSQYFRRKAND